MYRLRVLIFILLMLSGYLGVIGCGGGGAELKSDSYTTTLGQELQDLRSAYGKGIINEKEYAQAKKALIEQRTEKK